MRKAIIMIGVPGSGKTTWLGENYPNAVVCSADHYRTTPDGVYRFVDSETAECHEACLRKFVRSCEYDSGEVIVCDNTNSTLEQIAPYIAVALAYGREVEVVHCESLAAYERQRLAVPKQAWSAIFNRVSDLLDNWPDRWPDVRTVFT